jgi:tripartite-type tricarboxylate transporter receptor subunit TctC
MKMKRSHVLLLAALVVGSSSAVNAQDYPTRPVTIIVPYAPGGAADVGARLLGQKLSDRLGKGVIIENRGGGGTSIGAAAAAKAAPDGYTLFMGGSASLAVNVTLQKKLPYDPEKDFAPLALVVGIPFVLVVNPSLPVKSVADLVALAKEKPGQLTFATSGPGSPAHLQTELLKSMTGIDITLVPYKGSPPAVADFLGGQIQAMFVEFPASLQLIKDGKMRPLGVSTRARVPAASDIPSLADAGLPGFDAGGWLMFVAPANTPKEITAKLHAELKSIGALPEVQSQISGMGLIPIDTPAVENLQLYVKSEIERWGKVIHAAGIAGSE